MHSLTPPLHSAAGKTARVGTALGALVLGALLLGGYAAYQWTLPRGLHEFTYTPFTPEPLPYSPMRGFTYEQLWGHVWRVVLMTPALILLSFGWARLRPVKAVTDLRPWVWGAGFVCLGLTLAVLCLVLRGRAIVDDELSYAMQAQFMLQGRLTGSDVGFLPADVFSVATRLGYTGKYLPGEALIQVPGQALGLPALLHVPMLGLTLIGWYQSLVLRSGQRVAQLATLALALSPMLMLTSATGLSQASSLCWVVLAGLGLEWVRQGRSCSGAILAAAAFSMGMLTRPQSMLPIGVVLGGHLLWLLLKRQQWTALVWLFTSSALGALLLGLYDWALTGSALTPPWYLQCVIEHYGFGRVWKIDTFEHTTWTALQNLLVVAVRLNSWWLGFPLSLGVLGLWLCQGRRTHGAGVWFWAGLSVLLFQAGYYSPGVSDTGSAYHYELLLPGSVVAASVADHLWSRGSSWAPTALVVHLGLGTGSWLLEQSWRLQRLTQAIHADAERALAEITPKALLFYEQRYSETLLMGWVHDPFPRRYRGPDDPIVTFGNEPEPLRQRVMAAYPGRVCWYYYRDPDTREPRLLPCEQAWELMDRPLEAGERALWIPPTAYRMTDYNPGAANAARYLRDASGAPLLSCCSVRQAQLRGLQLKPEQIANCIEDGP